MAIGPAVRARLGRLEAPAAEWYRRAFVDLGHLTDLIALHVPHPRRILEIGCGDGSTADRLVRRYPDADYVGIDIVPEPGCRSRADPRRTTFSSMTSSALRSARPERFDLVVLVDVIHHIHAPAERERVLADAGALAGPDATLVVKDCEAQHSLGHYLQLGADRYVSGDREVRFADLDHFLALGRSSLPEWRPEWIGRVRPWRNNLVMGWRRAT